MRAKVMWAKVMWAKVMWECPDHHPRRQEAR